MSWKTESPQIFWELVNNQLRHNLNTYHEVTCSSAFKCIRSSPGDLATVPGGRGAGYRVMWFAPGLQLRPCVQKTASLRFFPLWTYPFLFFSLGPLLPELLDVRNIPVSKRRELTIDLSGKFCRTSVWKWLWQYNLFESGGLGCHIWQSVLSSHQVSSHRKISWSF